jgi:hypothetical protein
MWIEENDEANEAADILFFEDTNFHDGCMIQCLLCEGSNHSLHEQSDGILYLKVGTKILCKASSSINRQSLHLPASAESFQLLKSVRAKVALQAAIG